MLISCLEVAAGRLDVRMEFDCFETDFYASFIEELDKLNVVCSYAFLRDILRYN